MSKFINISIKNLTNNNTDDASSTSSAPSIFSGGIAIAKKIYIGGVLNSTDTTDASSTSVAGAVFSGGVGIAKQTRIGGAVTISNTTEAQGSSTTGALYCAGGIYAAKHVVGDYVIAKVAGANKFINMGYENNYTSGVISSYDFDATAYRPVSINLPCIFQSLNTTDATSTTVAGAVFSGGIACAKKLYVGGVLNSTDTTDASSTTVAGAVFSGGISCAKKLYVGGVLNSTDTTDATSTTAASAVFSGGIACAKKLYIGGVLNSTDTTDATTTSAAGAVFSGGVGIAKKLYVGGDINLSAAGNINSSHADGAFFDGQYGIICFKSSATTSNSGFYNSAESPYLQVSNNFAGAPMCKVFGTADASSTTVASAVFAGGVGIAKQTRIGGVVTISDTTASDGNATTGALCCDGGIYSSKKIVGSSMTAKAPGTNKYTYLAFDTSGTQGMLANYDADASLSYPMAISQNCVFKSLNTTDATTTTSAGAIFSGGVGIAKQTRIGGVVTISDTTAALGSATTGALCCAGGIYASKNVVGDTIVARAIGTTKYAFMNYDTTNSYGVLGSYDTVAASYKPISINSACIFQSLNTTEASSTTVAGAVFSGGVGVAKKLCVGGNINLAATSKINSDYVDGSYFDGQYGQIAFKTTNTSAWTGISSSTGSAYFQVYNNIAGAPMFKFNGTAEATSTSAASAVFSGGVGIAKKLYVGGETITNNTIKVWKPDITFMSVLQGIRIGKNDTLNNEVSVNFNYEGEASTGNHLAIAMGDGATNILMQIYRSYIFCCSDLEATSLDLAAFRITGGLAVKKNIYIGGNLECAAISNINANNVGGISHAMEFGNIQFKSGATTSSNYIIASSTGSALTNVYNDIAGAPMFKVNGTAEATSTTVASATFSGGVGIAKKLYVGGDINLSAAGNINSSHADGAFFDGQYGIVCFKSSATTSNTGFYNSAESPYLQVSNNFAGAPMCKVFGTADASSTTAASAVFAGGVGIAKKLYVGTGIYLPTTGGTPAELNSYEEYTHSTTFTGPFTSGTVDLKMVKCGKLCTVFIPVCGGTATVAAPFTMTTAFPVRFRPSLAFNSIINVKEATDGDTYGTAYVTNGGNMYIYYHGDKDFGIGEAIITASTFSYITA